MVLAECSGVSLAGVESQLNTWNQQWKHVLGGRSTVGSHGHQGSGPQTQGENRTNCKPTFDPSEAPIDLTKTFEFPGDSIVPAESLTELQSLCFIRKGFFGFGTDLVSAFFFRARV